MSAPAATYLRIPAVIAFGVLLASAAAARYSRVSAQASQAPAPQDSAPQQSSLTASPAPDAPATAPASSSTDAELTTEESSVPLRVLVNLVPVRVIVRDAKGHAVSTLRKEDFQLFQDGKPQIISNFSVVTPASIGNPVVATSAAPAVAPEPGAPALPAFLPPSRFVALLFDDAYINMQDAMQARIAAARYVDSSLAPTDRAAVFTVSGQFQVDFTDDRARLQAALKGIQPRAVTAAAETTSADCPPMEYYEADAIENRNNAQAITVAIQDAQVCMNPAGASTNPAMAAAQAVQAQGLVMAAALRKSEEGHQETEAVFRRLREILGRMAALPGQRNIVLISPGFIFPNLETEYSDIIDRAIRQSVFINTLDARGLYTPDLNGDISQPANDPNPAFDGIRSSYRLQGQTRQTETLSAFAADTGGWAFHGNNDLSRGLQEVASAPDAYYFLAFVPSNLKFDGHFHSLKVTLATKDKFAIQARRGYFAPLHGETPEEVAKRDIDDAIFSQEVRHGLAVGLQTQYYKTGATDAKLAVLAHVDLTHVRFTKTDGRNQDALTVVAAVFDRDGNFVTGKEEVVSMKLRDETYQRLSRSGVTVKTSFDLKPGDYVVRLVVRDSNAAALSAENGVVEIPY
jgi:VWFA-related protein